MKEANVTQLAELLNVSRQAVYKADQDGRIQRNANGKFDVEQTQSDWRKNTHPRHGGKRVPRRGRPPGPALHPGQEALLDFWFTVAEEAYPLLAVELAREHGMPPKEAWQFIQFCFYVQQVAALKVLQIPDEVPFPLEGFLQKLYHLNDESEPDVQEDLVTWLEKEMKKGEREDLDPSIWE